MTDDIIFIERLTFDAIIGVLPAERIHPQPVCIDLEITTDIQSAAASAHLADTLDYADLANEVQCLVVEAQFLLVESLAEAVAALALRYPQARAVAVTVSKPQALPHATGVGVRIRRQRS